MENIIFDGENYYFFRAYEQGDYEDKDGLIRADSSRYAKKNGEYGEYNRDSQPTLKEVYEHIRMRASLKTNCISFTKDASVAITYDTYGKYVVIKVSKENFGTSKVFDAAEYLMSETEKATERELNRNSGIENIVKEIENAETKEEIEIIFRKYSLGNPVSAIANRQYMNEEEQLRIAKLYTKVKLIEKVDNRDFKDHLVPGEDNSRILRTIANAYTSTEIIHYGDVPREITYNCPNVFLSMFSLLEQATEQATQNKDDNKINLINQLNNRLMKLVIEGYEINPNNGMLTNGTNEINLNLTREEIYDVTKDLTSREEIENDISIKKAFELTKGGEPFSNTKMQIMSATIMAEAINKKRILEKIFSQLFQDLEFEDILKDTYCISKDLAIKQNGRGYKIANTVNLLITQFGHDLNYEDAKKMIDILNGYSSEELEKITQLGIDYENIQDLLIVRSQRDDVRNRVTYKGKELDYYAEAIIEGFDWRKKRTLRTNPDKEKDEKYKLKAKLLSGVNNVEAFTNIYSILQQQNYSQQQIFAIIMNIAIDGKFKNMSYSQVMNLSKEEMQKLLLENSDSLQESLEIINLDILMGRGKAKEALKNKLLSLGVPQTIFDEKDEKNIYFAYKIVNEYKFDVELTKQEKTAIFMALVDNYTTKKGTSKYISNIYNEMDTSLKLSKQEIYGAIINTAVNGSAINESGFGYNTLISKYKKLIPILKGKESQIKTDVDELTISSATGELTQRIKKELLEYGIEEEFIDLKESENVISAKQIVEEFDFGKDLLDIEKGLIIRTILNNNQLNKNDVGNLRKLYLEMKNQLNLSNQQICGTIINMSINGNSTGIFNYSELLHSPAINVHLLVGKESQFIVSVNEDTILKATGYIPDELRKTVIEQSGMDNLFETATLRNIMAINEIINGYNYGRELAPDEIKSLYQAFIKSSHVSNNDNLAVLLTNLKEKTNFSNQEIYGIMINMAVYGNSTNERETAYSKLLQRPIIAASKLESQRDNINTVLDDYTIAYASGKIPETMKKELIDLGLKPEIISENSPLNVIQVKQIVDEYKYDRELSANEKVKMIESFLSYAHLNNSIYAILVNDIKEKLNMSSQEAYGILINSLAKNDDSLNNKMNINDLIKKPKLTIDNFVDKKNTLDTKVDDYRILNITGEYSEQNKKELLKLGFEEKYLYEKHPQNVMFAKKMIDKISQNRKLGVVEKRTLMQSLLDYSTLDTTQSGKLYRVYEELKEQFSLSDIETYNCMINMSNNIITTTNSNFSKLINAPGNIKLMNKDLIDPNLSEATIGKVLSNYMNEDEKIELEDNLVQLGVTQELIDKKRDSNLFFAKYIVDNYKFSRELLDIEKKALISKILDSAFMEPKNKVQLSNVVINFEKCGMPTQDSFGLIINLATKQSIIDEELYSYSNVLSSSNTARDLVISKLGNINLAVTEQTITKAVSETLTDKEKKEISSELLKLGVSQKNIVESGADIYLLQDIISNRDLGVNLSDRERVALFEELSNSISSKQLFDANCVLGDNGLNRDESARAIVNLLLENNLVDESNYSSTILQNSKNKMNEIFDKGMKLNLDVSQETIDKAVCNTLTENEVKELRKYYLNLGIPEEFVFRKEPYNLYMAKNIIERSDTGKKCQNDEIKAKFMINILNSTVLDSDENLKHRIPCLLSNMRKIVAKNENIYDVFIALSLDKVGNSNSYATLIRQPGKIFGEKLDIQINLALDNIENIKQKEIKINEKQEKVSIDLEKINESKLQMEELGINLEEYSSIREENFPAVMKIINEFEFGPNVANKEKIAIISQILNNSSLQKSARLEGLINRLENAGMNEQEAYGAIINLAVNNSSKKPGMSYSILLESKEDLNKEDFETKVTDTLISKARIAQTMNIKFTENQIKIASNIFKSRSKNEEICKKASDENICAAMMIVEKLSYKRELTIDEKTSIAENILNNTGILGSKYPYLTRMIATLEDKGVTEQEMCCAIINLSTNQSSLKKGCSYYILLKDFQALMDMRKEDFEFEITDAIIRKNCLVAKKSGVSKESLKLAYDKAINIGIPNEVLEVKDERNIFEALKILDGYEFSRELSKEEKLVILQSLISCSKLNKGKGYFFTNLINRYAELGLNENEIYGSIINTALGNTNKGYSMAKILPNSASILELSKEQIHTVVSEEYIQRAINKRRKAMPTMKSAVANMKKNVQLGIMGSIGEALDDLSGIAQEV